MESATVNILSMVTVKGFVFNVCNLIWLIIAQFLRNHQILGQCKGALAATKTGLIVSGTIIPSLKDYANGWLTAN